MRRELVTEGQPRFIEPRPFDVLVYLLRHRERVVSKDELLDALWRGDPVSVGVIARAVMKARQAIGDSGKESELIRTVHRNGYRFVGKVEVADAPDEPTAATRPRTTPPIAPPVSDQFGAVTLALLPFQNGTGEAEYDWIELGLMSMVARALSADHRLAVASTASVLTALAGGDAAAHVDARVLAVRRVLGVTHVVHAAIRRDGERFALDYGIGPLASGRTRLPGHDPIVLANQLAREIQATLFPGHSPTLPMPFDSADPLAGPVLARAMQAVGEQKWKVAVNLLQVVLDIEQASLPIRLEHMAALAHLGDERSLALGEQLLCEPRVAADALLSARVHQALGTACNNLRQSARAIVHLDETLRLAERYEQQEWVTIALLLRSSIAIGQLDFDRADELLDHALRLCGRSGNQVHRLGWMVNAALISAKRGDMLGAMQLGRDAVRLSTEHRLNSYFALTSLNLAHACFGLGLIHAAVKHAEDSFTMASSLAERFRMASAADTLCLLYRELRAPEEIERVLRALEPIQSELQPPAQAYVLMARGHHAAVQDRHADAARFFGGAIQLGKDLRDWLTVHESSPWLVASLVQSGQSAQAQHACDETWSLPEAQDDADLRASMLHCRALRDHAGGDAALALRALRSAVDASPMGMWRAHACLDAAWLHLEAGEVDAARLLIRDLGTWVEEHPIAIAVEARLRFARAQFGAADEAHRRYAKSLQFELPAYFVRLGDLYAEAARETPDRVPALPCAPCLPTRMH